MRRESAGNSAAVVASGQSIVFDVAMIPKRELPACFPGNDISGGQRFSGHQIGTEKVAKRRQAIVA